MVTVLSKEKYSIHFGQQDVPSSHSYPLISKYTRHKKIKNHLAFTWTWISESKWKLFKIKEKGQVKFLEKAVRTYYIVFTFSLNIIFRCCTKIYFFEFLKLLNLRKFLKLSRHMQWIKIWFSWLIDWCCASHNLKF